MAEYISREAFITRQKELYCQNCDRRRGMKDGKLTKRFVYPIGGAPCRACDVDDMINAVEDYPAADVRPVVRGKWIDEHIYKQTMNGKTYDGFTYCSNCKTDYDFGHRAKFCEACGADMREPPKEETE